MRPLVQWLDFPSRTRSILGYLKNKACFAESYPATGGLFAYAGKGLHIGLIVTSSIFFCEELRCSSKSSGGTQQGHLEIFRAFPCHWLAESLPKKQPHYRWPYKPSLATIVFPKSTALQAEVQCRTSWRCCCSLIRLLKFSLTIFQFPQRFLFRRFMRQCFFLFYLKCAGAL